MKNKRIILGIGTGRCGTVSLMGLFNKQLNSSFSHELKIKKEKKVDYNTPLTWDYNEIALNSAWRSIQNYNGVYVGDIAMFWLPYLEKLFSMSKDLKVICLQRDKEEVVKSFLKKTEMRNHWMNHDGIKWNYCPWDNSYPNFEAETKEEALNFYWEYYYEQVDILIQKYPDKIRIFHVSALNSEDKVEELLTFAGFHEKKIITKIKRNKIEKHIFDKIRRKIFGA